ncbi:hypothetical protein VP1G_08666 [Cytospora mali]|uniref:Uncharacterized protein n=1 Tax=Cytospora mali TaxID=578113 RepID=A0A194VC78_CYTMA|nr:hypothetical protein VP1G_08666 [Valsa mali var. pyri (nom. inval.)]
MLLVRLILILTATSLATAYPTWWLAVYKYRCKPLNIVESYSQDWNEWRVSSICAPGTCCATSADTGPLCTAEACDKAVKERERLLKTYNTVEASKKKAEEAKKAKEEDKEKKEKEAEEKWKLVDAKAEAEREKALVETQAQA